jgi:hypothetical protein
MSAMKARFAPRGTVFMTLPPTDTIRLECNWGPAMAHRRARYRWTLVDL